MNPVRVRFAPSPTGPLHIGGLRTALYNYLYAKNKGGAFILRVEDTDQNRYVEGAEDYIREALNWAGLKLDEGPDVGGDYGPYRQSERRKIYQSHIQTLIDNGQAYYAFDSAAEIENMRTQLEQKGVHSPKYNFETRMQMRNSITLSDAEVKTLMDASAAYTIRLRVEPQQEIGFEDIIRGRVVFNSSELDDKVLMKSDGLPTYHLANVIDDHEMKISHVIRGEEWLSSTAHHVLLYRAFGWESSMPKFAHLPLILKPTGKGKLSKRDGQKMGIPVFPIQWNGSDEMFGGFREMGFLPEAVVNFLAFLGWNPGSDQEIFTLEELMKAFKLTDVSKGGARFDFEKAKWFNQQYILTSDASILVEELKKQLKEVNIERSEDFLNAYVELFRPRIERLADLFEAGKYFFQKVDQYNNKMIRKKWKENGIITYNFITENLAQVSQWNAANCKSVIEDGIAACDSSFGEVLPLLRLALSGDVKGPDLFDTMKCMGKLFVIDRLKSAPNVFDQLIAES